MKATTANGNNINNIIVQNEKPIRFFFMSFFTYVKEMKREIDRRKLIHSIKVGIALVLVSLLYLLNSLFDQVGENAMWAIMTVVVVFEFYAGATIGKGINRGIGTVIGGGLGCLAAILGDEITGIGNPIIVACSVFIFGAAATYCRLVPRLKKRYDYGFMISILTFNLVAVSGVRANKVVELARSRLATIGIGFAICIFISLLISPIWASNELHYSTASKFGKIASSIQGCLDEYLATEKENQAGKCDYIQACNSVLNSKSNDESLANYAKWEPWHWKFGLNYPWEKYLEVGEHLRELAAIILSLKGCIQSSQQPPAMQRQSMKDPCENFILSTQCILRELGECIEKMEKCPIKISIGPKLQLIKLQLSPSLSSNKIQVLQCDENIAITTFKFLLMEIVEKVEILAKKVEELGELANFRVKRIDV